MKQYKQEILKRLSNEEKNKLSELGKKIIDEVDLPHLPKTMEDIQLVSRIMVMVRWIKQFEEIGSDWAVNVEDGLPYIEMVCDEDEDDDL